MYDDTKIIIFYTMSNKLYIKFIKLYQPLLVYGISQQKALIRTVKMIYAYAD